MTPYLWHTEAYPHHTDFGGIVWHGHYISWLEAARVAALAECGIPFATMVAADLSLVVVDLSLQYKAPVRLGEHVTVKAWPQVQVGIRLPWDYEVWVAERLCVRANVRLAAIKPSTGQPYRRFPPLLKSAYERLLQPK